MHIMLFSACFAIESLLARSPVHVLADFLIPAQASCVTNLFVR